MSAVLAAGILLSLVGLAIGTLLLVLPSTRARGARLARGSFLLLAVTFVGMIAVIIGTGQETQTSSTQPRLQTERPAAAEVDASAEDSELDLHAEEGARRAAEAVRLAHWDVRRGTSQLDDSASVQLALRSNDVHQDRYGRRKPLTLTIICRENRTNAYISFAEHFMSDIQGKGRVDYRVDEKAARHRNFRESNDHSVLGLWGGSASIPWLRELFGGQKLYVRATPFSESAVSGEFNISGIEEVIQPLREACNW
ncbi:hypothetical protein GRZ55_11470 [Chelativorans sp. ZYF759]|uniref:type VI secretion system-associated protein TagO n=1 Tax=Chelativorans sp. ZYF759 TaxID=2692213 RepID=UPI00145E9E9A|nr:type VI secretion system-associated protein TagO [Chelativorans sp. ZYF759]NMG39862.1 hypothetical protein [Chelativorans sp. ZYF759]